MRRSWTLGPEVRRVVFAGGAMLYDVSRASNFSREWFLASHWRSRGEIDGETAGRGATLLLNAGGHRLVLRHYRRGGLVAKLVKDRFLWRGEFESRPFNEWHLTYHLKRANLPVPTPIAAQYLRRGSTYSADIITERIDGAPSLATRIAQASLPIDRWIAIGRCIRRFHDFGVCHADLNAHNILLDAEGVVYLIDFDRGALRHPGLWCDDNLARLHRSLSKIRDAAPGHVQFLPADWHSLLAGYRGGGEASRAPTVPPG